jgi:hypothetical protein
MLLGGMQGLKHLSARRTYQKTTTNASPYSLERSKSKAKGLFMGQQMPEEGINARLIFVWGRGC